MSPPISVSAAARSAAAAQLAAQFNANLSAAFAAFGAADWAVEFADPSQDGGTFYQAKVNRDQLYALMKAATSCLVIWSDEVEDKNWMHPMNFSGDVVVSGDVHRWIPPTDLASAEAELDAIESALIATFNGPDEWANGGGVYYNHAIRVERSGWEFFKDGLITTVHFQLTFEVNA